MRRFTLLALLAVLLLPGCMVLIVVDESTRPAPTPSTAGALVETVTDAVATDTTLGPRPSPTP